MSAHDAGARRLISRQAALTKHSRSDGREATSAARTAASKRFELQVDPDGVLPVAERLRRAELARRAHMIRLARKSAQSRRKGQAT